jgi:hypothetical protein
MRSWRCEGLTVGSVRRWRIDGFAGCVDRDARGLRGSLFAGAGNRVNCRRKA